MGQTPGKRRYQRGIPIVRIFNSLNFYFFLNEQGNKNMREAKVESSINDSSNLATSCDDPFFH